MTCIMAYHMVEKKTGRPVKSVGWDGPDLLMTYADGAQETVRFAGARLVSHKVEYPADSGVVVEEMTGWSTDAP